MAEQPPNVRAAVEYSDELSRITIDTLQNAVEKLRDNVEPDLVQPSLFAVLANWHHFIENTFDAFLGQGEMEWVKVIADYKDDHPEAFETPYWTRTDVQ